MERKVAYANGRRSVEETIELNAKITQLKDQLELQERQVTLLNGQVLCG